MSSGVILALNGGCISSWQPRSPPPLAAELQPARPLSWASHPALRGSPLCSSDPPFSDSRPAPTPRQVLRLRPCWRECNAVWSWFGRGLAVTSPACQSDVLRVDFFFPMRRSWPLLTVTTPLSHRSETSAADFPKSSGQHSPKDSPPASCKGGKERFLLLFSRSFSGDFFLHHP